MTQSLLQISRPLAAPQSTYWSASIYALFLMTIGTAIAMLVSRPLLLWRTLEPARRG